MHLKHLVLPLVLFAAFAIWQWHAPDDGRPAHAAPVPAAALPAGPPPNPDLSVQLPQVFSAQPALESAYIAPATEGERLWRSNHQALLSSLSQIGAVISALKDGNPPAAGAQEMNAWARALYRDALFAQAYNQAPDTLPDGLLQALYSDNPEFDPILIPARLPTAEPGYGNALRQFLIDHQSRDLYPLNHRGILAYANAAGDLMGRRKLHSDNFYRTEIKRYLRDDKLPVDGALDYVQLFVDQGDWELVEQAERYYSRYFASRQLSAADAQAAREFWSRAKQP